MYVYIYIYIGVDISIYIYIYIGADMYWCGYISTANINISCG